MNQMMDSVISIQNLHKSFSGHNVLRGIDLEIERGKSIVILGGSGTGKSVLIKTVIGLLTPTSGTVKINGLNTANLDSQQKEEILRKCGFLFQAGALFDSLNIEDNITFFAEKLYGLTKKQKKEMAEKKLEVVGLSSRLLKLFPSEISGGMQKRVSLARTICTNPEIIFFDEPTTGLDPIMSNVINELIVDIKNKLGATCVTITHDMNSARKIADNIAMIYEGKIIWQGEVNELDKVENPIVTQFINGKTTGPILS